MIIWGFRVVYRALTTGIFYCPEEGGDRPYTLKSSQRFFTLFFIPLIPLKQNANVVECQSCMSKFYETVLQRPTASLLSNAMGEAVRGAAIAVLRSGTLTDAGKQQTILLVSHYITGYDDAMLLHDKSQLDLGPLPTHLGSLSSSLDEHGRELLLHHLVLVAVADKAGVNESERNILLQVGSDLGMTEAHCRGTIDSIVEGSAKA
jgi:hypothetical protein